MPEAHAVVLMDFWSGHCLPAGHGMQSDMPAKEYVPSGQALITPVELLQLTPAGQVWHFVDLAKTEYFPAGQLSGAFVLSGQTLPAGQSLQVV